jgi:uncharacterized protein (DUF1684 family)
MATPADPVSLAHWRRSVAELYAEARALSRHDPAAAAQRFRERRDRLFVEHPQSPLPPAQRTRGGGASWYPYDAAWRALGRYESAATATTFDVPLLDDGVLRCSRTGSVHFNVRGVAAKLEIYWLEGYGGGLWLPFADATNGRATYGGGRYLYDTIKGADLGASTDLFVLDFNFAYNPSCAYDDHWSCPLAPPANRLPFAVEAGERVPT